jgi:hypothetical protein
MKITVENLVSTIQSLDPKFKYFHLTECFCGSPMWQQPCLICSYYPQWGQTNSYSKGDDCTKETFSKYINHSGNILEFYFKSFMRTLDPQKHILDNARKTTQGWEWPSAEEIWDYFKNKEKTK